jgi:hypothetical protein
MLLVAEAGAAGASAESSSDSLVRRLSASAGIVPHVDPLVLVADAITAVLVFLLVPTYQNDVRLDFVVAGDNGTELSPLSFDFDMLVEREFRLSHGILLDT